VDLNARQASHQAAHSATTSDGGGFASRSASAER